MPSRKLNVVGELLVDLLYTVVFEEDLWDCDKKASGHHVMKTVRGSAKELCEICERVSTTDNSNRSNNWE